MLTGCKVSYFSSSASQPRVIIKVFYNYSCYIYFCQTIVSRVANHFFVCKDSKVLKEKKHAIKIGVT